MNELEQAMVNEIKAQRNQLSDLLADANANVRLLRAALAERDARIAELEQKAAASA